jgi:hypothetical protein
VVKLATIKIEATSTVDTWVRYHGLAIDSELKPSFWTTQQEKIIGTTAPPFTYTTTVNLTNGTHTITYGNSASAGYEWDAKIYVDGKLVASGKVSRDKYLVASVKVEGGKTTPTTPTLTDIQKIAIAVAIAIIVIIMVVIIWKK